MIGLLKDTTVVGCDGRTDDGHPCPKLVLFPGSPGLEYMTEHLGFHGWGINEDGNPFTAITTCPHHTPAPPTDGTW